VARLRYSRAEAEAEATRRAKEFIANRPDYIQMRYGGTVPNSRVKPSRTSKHPFAWIVIFDPIPPDGCVIDGGELLVAVNLETGEIGYSEQA